MPSAQQLMQFLTDLVNNPKYAPKDGCTFCNFGLQACAGTLYSFHGFDNMEADDIVTKAKAGQIPSIVQTTAEDAVRNAMNGGFGFAGHFYPGHGHVATIAPMPMGFSGSWNKAVPILGN